MIHDNREAPPTVVLYCRLVAGGIAPLITWKLKRDLQGRRCSSTTRRGFQVPFGSPT